MAVLVVTSTTDVGRLVPAAAPSSALPLTNRYGTPTSSHRMGMCDSTSMGEMSAASTVRLRREQSGGVV